MSNLLTRSISALVYAVIFISAILFSAETYIGLIAIFASVCVFEFSKIINANTISIYTILALTIATTFFAIIPSYTELLLGFSLFCLVITLYYLFSSKLFNYKSKTQKVFLQYIYVILPFIFLAKLPFIDNSYHPNIIIYIILIIWTNDSFAYLVGKNFGKHKLFEKVSPKKTIEGFIGGLVFAILAGFLIGKYSTEFSVTNWIVIAIIVSIFGNLGDLVESKFKRQAKVKDSGTIMPGHGGLLDRLDSLFFLAPFVYLYIHYIL